MRRDGRGNEAIGGMLKASGFARSLGIVAKAKEKHPISIKVLVGLSR